jgi:hypothetical protein
MKKNSVIFLCGMLTFILCFSGISYAGLAGEDLEKPKPEFKREGKIITAKLIPRAKSTSILIDFEVTGGDLKEVKGLEFKTAERPGHTWRDFRSELFMMDISGVEPGGEVIVSARSSFFTGSTGYWIFNERLPESWMNTEADNVKVSENRREFAFKVKDGGPFDADGAADGKIFLVGGPRDSFWGYVMGTLFIRFFGVFIVLSVLMVGMMLAGRAFQTGEKKFAGDQEASAAAGSDVCLPEKIQIQSGPSPETAAVIALALDIHFSAARSPESIPVADVSLWAMNGRTRMMGDRMMTYYRNIQK